MSLSRRGFLKSGLAALGGLLVPRQSTSATPAVSAAKATGGTPGPLITHVTGGSVAQKVRTAVDALGGMAAFVKPGNTVVITPNVGFPNPPENATTTDPMVIREIAALCEKAGAKRVYIADHPVRNSKLCFAKSGMMTAADGLMKTEVVPLSKGSAWVEVKVPGHEEIDEIEIPVIVKEADVFIAAPVAKCHGSAKVSFAMKGMMGMVLDRRSMHWRYDLHQGIVDICRVLNPALVITDATRALVTRGPGGPGRVETPDAIVAGANMVSVDAYTLTLAKWYNKGFTWSEVPHLKLAHEQGFGEVDSTKMNVKRITL